MDAASPESDQARHFRDSVQAYVASGYTNRAAEGEIRTFLAAWHDNDARLRPLLERSFLLHELAPFSEDLSILGVAGLFALDHLNRSEPSPESWRVQLLALLERAKTPKADLQLMVVAAVQQLIEASAGQTQKP